MEEKGGVGGGEETTEKCGGPHRRCRVAEEAPLWTLLLPPLIQQPSPRSFHRYPSPLPHASSLFLPVRYTLKYRKSRMGPLESTTRNSHDNCASCKMLSRLTHTRRIYQPDDCSNYLGPTQGRGTVTTKGVEVLTHSVR
ncbi:hypothetical protein BHE74_00023051 [Ensete ventricosum]|nr:hypothetical protein BHE74_00023051 [Ensete ventricosum]